MLRTIAASEPVALRYHGSALVLVSSAGFVSEAAAVCSTGAVARSLDDSPPSASEERSTSSVSTRELLVLVAEAVAGV